MHALAPQRKEAYALGLVALSAILYGFLGYLGTQLLKENFSVSAMLFWRFFIATVWILSFSVLKGPQTRQGQQQRRALLKPFLLGAFFYGGGSALFFIACRHTGTGLAMVIFFCHPLFVALLVWLRDKRDLNKFTLLSLALILLGLILLKGRDENALSLIGIACAMGAALCYALYVFNSKKILSQFSPEACTAIVCFSSALVFFILATATGTFAWPNASASLFYILALGIIATALPIQLLLKGLQVVGPVKASILSVLEPVMTLVIGVVLLHELISPLQTLGILVILLGALTAQFSRA